MIDRYTKIVLTVIAVSLVAVLVQNQLKPAHAFSDGSCGSSIDPCYVTIGYGRSLNVWVENWP